MGVIPPHHSRCCILGLLHIPQLAGKRILGEIVEDFVPFQRLRRKLRFCNTTRTVTGMVEINATREETVHCTVRLKVG
jgi:hypothetical protein